VNAHKAEKQEVLYLFHPWAGCIVHIHEVLKKPAGDVCRCSHDSRAIARYLELPMWMFDRAACAAIQIEAHPRVHITALSALMVLLRQAAGAGDSNSTALSNAPTCGVRRVSHDQNRGDSNAISSRSSPGRSKHRKTIRFLRSGRTGTAAVADAARRGAQELTSLLTRLILDHAGADNPRLLEECTA
jgi:hypothetical protein